MERGGDGESDGDGSKAGEAHDESFRARAPNRTTASSRPLAQPMISAYNAVTSEDRAMAEFAHRGKNVTIFPLAKIIDPAAITVGSNVIIDDFVFIGRHEGLV